MCARVCVLYVNVKRRVCLGFDYADILTKIDDC